MKAVLATEYGSPDILQIADVPKPTIRRNEVLIRVRATTVSSGDWRIRSLTVPTGFTLLSRLLFGIMRPRQPILGTELAGEVVAVGEEVKRFGVGDPVFAYTSDKMGAHAEFTTMPEEGALAHKPPNLTYEEAAALSFGGVTAPWVPKMGRSSRRRDGTRQRGLRERRNRRRAACPAFRGIRHGRMQHR
jgi:NADPH:quinone reductase-like Zn-dependent oxidoreductase